MHEPDIHDLSDDADYAAASKQGSSSMNGTDSSKRSSSSDPEDAELVYLKDNVTIHPTQYATERISGRLKLIKQGSSLFMTWIPYKGQSSNARLSERDKNLYTIRAIPFSDIQSIRRHTPTIGWQYVIVVLSSGLAYPPLYFYSGGVREFLATIKQHVLIARSSEDANVFLVNNFQDPLQRTLSSLELPRSLAKGSPSSSFKRTPSDERLDKGTLEDNQLSNNIQQNNRQRQKSHDPARDISIQVLEKFSLVTRFARETTSQLFRENLVDGHGPAEKRRNNWASKEHQRLEIASNDVDDVPKRVPVASDPLEFEKLSLVWGQPRQHPLGLEEWSTFLDSEGRVGDPSALRKRIFYGGVEHNLRKEVWGFLLGYYSYDSTYAERQYVVSVKKSEYETIKNQWQSISPEQAKRFTKFRERRGLIEKDVVRTDRSLPFYDGAKWHPLNPIIIMANLTTLSLTSTTTWYLNNTLSNLKLKLQPLTTSKRTRTLTTSMSASTATKVIPSIIVGGGRVGRALQDMGNGQDLLVKRGEPVPLDFPGPILVCTRNDDLDAVLDSTPQSRWSDLVFFQNGMLEPWFQSKGLGDADQVLAYFAVSKLGEPPVDGITDANPEGLTAAFGKWASAVAARLQAGGLSCKVLEKEPFQKQMLEKLIWISAFMLVGARYPGATVGDVEKDHRFEVISLIGELATAAAAEKGIVFEVGIEERLLAYARAVSHFPTAVKEFKWRNGWFYSLSEKAIAQGKQDPCPLHTKWLKELNIVQ